MIVLVAGCEMIGADRITVFVSAVVAFGCLFVPFIAATISTEFDLLESFKPLRASTNASCPAEIVVVSCLTDFVTVKF